MGKNDGNKVVSDNWVSRKGDMKRYNKTIKQRTLDNRRSNLEAVTVGENTRRHYARNGKKRRKQSSKR